MVALLLAGCGVQQKQSPVVSAPKPEPTPREVMDRFAEEAARKKARPPLADLAPIAPLEPQLASETRFPFEKKQFSIEVIDEPLGNVLLGLAMAADLNLILGQDVDRSERVSVKMNNLPLKTALDTIITTHNYHYTIEKNILRVEGLRTQIFTVDYPLVYNSPESESGGDILGGGGSGGGGGGNNGTSAISSSGLKGEFKVKVEVKDEEELDVWKKIEKVLQPPKGGKREGGSLLSEHGSASINRMAGTIVVSDRPKQLKLVHQFLDRINRILHRQVVIEAKVVEVGLNKGHAYGIDWSVIKTTVGQTYDINQKLLQGVQAFTFNFADTTGAYTLTAALDALATQGTVNVLASPRVNVLNNQTALITVGRVIPYIDLTITTTEDEVNGEPVLRTSSEPTIARTLEGVTLGITAQISEEGVTTLHIMPIITEQTGNRSLTVGTNTFDIPVFSVRESDTMIKASDRETVVLGGLIMEKTSDDVQKVPILGDIPFVKAAFSKQSRNTAKTELVILLTTTVYNQ
jgi:MSHA biogenesis protein MshL